METMETQNEEKGTGMVRTPLDDFSDAKRKRVLKYYEALKELHKTLKYTDWVKMNQFMKSHKLNANFSRVLFEGKIVSTNGKKGTGARYKWDSIDPTIGMAIEVDKRLSDISRDYAEKKAQKVAEESMSKPTPVEDLPNFDTAFDLKNGDKLTVSGDGNTMKLQTPEEKAIEESILNNGTFISPFDVEESELPVPPTEMFESEEKKPVEAEEEKAAKKKKKSTTSGADAVKAMAYGAEGITRLIKHNIENRKRTEFSFLWGLITYKRIK